jgi:hypothetical protein
MMNPAISAILDDFIELTPKDTSLEDVKDLLWHCCWDWDLGWDEDLIAYVIQNFGVDQTKQ